MVNLTDLPPQQTRHPAANIGAQLREISPQSVEIVERLREKGFEAYIVGGCIRDLLLDQTPKDFDVATDAEPEEVIYLFKRARIIGRRFQIVHVREGRETVEVTTFRAHHDDEVGSQRSERSDTGMLLRDNVYGNLAEDASRRDFTVNALYFCPETNEIIDYANGIDDIKSKSLRIIGIPEIRYQEDPVRMLRAARFVAKLGFELDKPSIEAIADSGSLLLQIAPARLFDEALKLFLGGYASRTLESLQRFGLFKFLFPATDKALKAGQEYAQELIEATMLNTDIRIEQGKPVTPAFLFAALLWPAVVTRKDALQSNDRSPFEALKEAGRDVNYAQMNHTALPKRFSIPMREIWELHTRLERHEGKRAAKLRSNVRFRAAYDFVLLREQSGEDLNKLGEWWTEYQEQNPVESSHARRGGRNSHERGNAEQRKGNAPEESQIGNESGNSHREQADAGSSQPKQRPQRNNRKPKQNNTEIGNSSEPGNTKQDQTRQGNNSERTTPSNRNQNKNTSRRNKSERNTGNNSNGNGNAERQNGNNDTRSNRPEQGNNVNYGNQPTHSRDNNRGTNSKSNQRPTKKRNNRGQAKVPMIDGEPNGNVKLPEPTETPETEEINFNR